MGVPVIGLVYGRRQIGIASRFLDESIRCTDPELNEERFIEELLGLANRWPGAVVLPTDDASLVAISRQRDQLLPKLRVVSDEWSIVQKLIEKHETYALATKAGVPCPRIQLVRSTEQALELAESVGFPCLLKPSVGHIYYRKFGRKMLFVEKPNELEQAVKESINYGGDLMISEFIPGLDDAGANYNSFSIDGHVVHEFTARKVRNKPSQIGFPTAVESIWLSELAQLGREMLAVTKYSGFSCMEFKRDARGGGYKLMEINARHNFSGELANVTGINFPYLSYLHAVGEDLPETRCVQRDSVYWIDDERDPLGLLRALWTRGESVEHFLRPYKEQHVFATYSAIDPMPFLKQTFTSAAQAIRRSVSRAVRFGD
jgi:predicted ATP-grasp superfamily ATP-dependent carboligase